MQEGNLEKNDPLSFNFKAHELIEHVKEHAIFMLDSEGFIRSWNSAAFRIKGYQKEEVLGKHFSIFYPEEVDPESFTQYALKEAREHGKFEDEGWRKKKDGSLFWAYVVIEALPDEKGGVLGYLKITRDFSQQKSERDLLRDSEERYKLLIESIKEYAVFMLDPNGKINTWNSGAQRLFGFTEKQIVGKHFSVFYNQETVEAGYPEYELKKAIEDGQFTDEGWRVRKDGSLFYASVLLKPLFGANQKLLGFSKVTKDLTERKQNEQLLKESEDHFHLLVDNISDYAIYMLDTTGHVVTWNKGATKIKGYTENEVLGRHYSVFYTRQNIDEGLPGLELKQALRFGRCEGEGWRMRKNGQLFWARYILAPLYNSTSELIGFSKITRDLSERKKSEKKLGESEDRYKLLVDSVQDYAIFILDSKGYVLTWNLGAEKIKGYKI